ncbi:MAG TPA: hypothetical protein VMZ28_27395, partial [Kofleriaceae bacterium]|nr:hypothetical protein [Kofleriaceae bacterium]
MIRPALVLCALTACAPSRAELFGPVDREVSARIGADVAWRDGPALPADDARAIDALLAQPLDADRAARVALLASPALQVSFAELGVSGAEVARAGALPNPELEAEVRFPVDDDDRDATVEISLL